MFKVFYIVLTVIFLFNVVGYVSAAERGLEVIYPTIPGVGITPQTVEGTSLPDYVKYIFNFAIWIVGFLAFVVLILGGVRYLTSAGNPATMDDSKKQMFAGILGMILLFSSYMILTTINPELVVFDVQDLTAITATPGAGIWLCTSAEDFPKSCYNVITNQVIPENFNNKVNYVYLINGGTPEAPIKYGAVIYGNEDFSGNCQVVTNSGANQVNPEGSSVTPFIIDSNPSGAGVTLYEKPDLDKSGSSLGPLKTSGGGLNPSYSIEIMEPKQFIAVAFDDNSNKCQVFDQSDRNLEDDYIGDFCGIWPWWQKPCVGSLKVFGGRVIGELPR